MTSKRALVFMSLLALTFSARAALAQSSPARTTGYDSSHPFAFGARLTGRAGDYAMGGFGGHLRLRPVRAVVIEAHMDNFFGSVDGVLRHDHEVGSTLQLTVLGDARFTAYPLIGACAMLVMVDSPRANGPGVSDVRFGLHGGFGAEYYVAPGFTLQGQLEAIAYMGHTIRTYSWSAEVSPELSYYAVGQLTLAANYYF